MSNDYKRVLSRFEKAVRAHEMKGAQPPADWNAIEKEYENAKRAIINRLAYREPVVDVCNPIPMSEEELAFHVRAGTISETK